MVRSVIMTRMRNVDYTQIRVNRLFFFCTIHSTYNFETNNTNIKWHAREGVWASCITSWALAPATYPHHPCALRLRGFEGFSSRAGRGACLLHWHSSLSTRARCEYSRWISRILFQHVVNCHPSFQLCSYFAMYFLNVIPIH